MLAFVERWRDTVANAKEARIRDQAAFNMLTKAKPLAQYKRDGSWLKRIFATTISGIGELKLTLTLTLTVTLTLTLTLTVTLTLTLTLTVTR